MTIKQQRANETKCRNKAISSNEREKRKRLVQNFSHRLNFTQKWRVKNGKFIHNSTYYGFIGFFWAHLAYYLQCSNFITLICVVFCIVRWFICFHRWWKIEYKKINTSMFVTWYCCWFLFNGQIYAIIVCKHWTRVCIALNKCSRQCSATDEFYGSACIARKDNEQILWTLKSVVPGNWIKPFCM